MTRFTARIFPYQSRVSLKEAFEGLEPDEGKLSRPVLRGLALSNEGRLLGYRSPQGVDTSQDGSTAMRTALKEKAKVVL